MNLQGLKKPSGRVLQCYLQQQRLSRQLNTIKQCKSPTQISDMLLSHHLKKTIDINVSPFCVCPMLRGKHYSTSNDAKQESVADEHTDSVLQTATISDKKSSTFTEIVPGKGPPPEPPVDCCMSGCANCVWIKYAEELKDYYSDGTERALREIEKIDNPSLKAFIKLELSLL
ncbi:oxidoreductase-like domain-containing protein 1 [Argopecten irradians]|uniref:oxidoreductase-like domain-containing protein 1 n=1 Tax=Argopecten irradians TaxID=31199 RepID=UPI003712376F